MFRKLLLVGIFAGSSASIPILYQSNSETFQNLLHQVMQGSEAPTKKLTAPVAAVSTKPLDQEVLPGRKVRLAADATGHFVTDFKLNGRRVKAMVDTGATLVAINQSTARRIGISLTPADFKYKVATANGDARAAGVTIETLQIGRIAVDNVQAVVLEDQALDGTLIGMSFLKQLSKFQVEDGALLLVQ
jgi:aspartyl protease family protein